MFKGVGTALITPFQNNGQVDFNLFEKIIQNQLANKVDALIVLGTTGESPTIKFTERAEIIKFVVEKTAGKIPVIVGTGTNDTNHVVEMNQQAVECGANGLLIVTPYYNKTNQAGLVEHYTYIAEQTELPIIVYNVPSRTGVNIEAETFQKMSQQAKNIVAIKEASGNMSQILKMIDLSQENIKLFSGNDDQTLPVITSGGAGVISVFSNLLPGVMKKITSQLIAGEYQSARKLYYKYLKLMNLLFIDVNPIPIKFAMAQLELSNNNLRRPLVKLAETKQNALINEMKELELI